MGEIGEKIEQALNSEWEWGRKAGIKEVVEWIRCEFVPDCMSDELYDAWLAQLKRWGINAT